MIVHRSPLLDVEISDERLTPYVMAGAAEAPDRLVLIDGPTARS